MVLTAHWPLFKRHTDEFPDEVPAKYRRDLVKRAIEGDTLAFARLYDLYVERVYGYMHFHLNDEQAAEDLTARVFLRAWRGMPCYEPDKPPFHVWLYLIARQALIDFEREQRGGRVLDKEILSPADEGLDIYDRFEPCEGRK